MINITHSPSSHFPNESSWELKNALHAPAFLLATPPPPPQPPTIITTSSHRPLPIHHSFPLLLLPFFVFFFFPSFSSRSSDWFIAQIFINHEQKRSLLKIILVLSSITSHHFTSHPKRKEKRHRHLLACVSWLLIPQYSAQVRTSRLQYKHRRSRREAIHPLQPTIQARLQNNDLQSQNSTVFLKINFIPSKYRIDLRAAGDECGRGRLFYCRLPARLP